MTGDKVKSALKDMQKLMYENADRFLDLTKPDPPLSAKRSSPEHTVNGLFVMQLEHLLYMCDEIPKLFDEGKIEKAMRWLGFLQGVLWSLGVGSLDTFKRMNMPEEKE